MLKAGIVGAGLMGRWHADAVKHIGGLVVFVVDTNLDHAKILAETVNAPFYTDTEQAISEHNVDIVHICTPLETHATIAEYLIRKSIHLIIEKPVAPDAESTQYLIDLAKHYNVSLLPVHQFAFQEGITQSKELLQRLNEVNTVRLTFYSAGAEKTENSDDVVYDILPHPLSILIGFFGTLPQDWQVVHPRPGEWQTTAIVDEMRWLIDISMSVRPTRAELFIGGDTGSIYANLFHGYALWQNGNVSRRQKILQPFFNSTKEFAASAQNLVKRSIRREPAYPGLRQLLYQAYTAIETGTELPISADETLTIALIRDRLMHYSNHDKMPVQE